MISHKTWLRPSRRALAAALASSTLLLGACQSITQAPSPCCYQGDVTAAPLQSLYLELEDGRRVAFDEIFEGFQPDTNLIGLNYPIRSAEIRRVTYENLSRVLPYYDSNENYTIEHPELAVLYVREAAIGMGFDVAAVGTNPHVSALSLSQADQSGLLRFVRTNSARFTPEQRKIFAELELLGTELSSQGRSHEDRDRGPVYPSN